VSTTTTEKFTHGKIVPRILKYETAPHSLKPSS